MTDEQLSKLNLSRNAKYKIINSVKIDGINDRIEFENLQGFKNNESNR